MSRIAPLWHRAYLRSHPLGLAVVLGVFVSGTIQLFFPPEPSAAAQVLPEWVLDLFNICWFFGGGAATLGMLRGWIRAEIAGLMLVAGGLLAYWCVLISIRTSAIWAAFFIGALGLGCAVRAWSLLTCGYDYDSRLRR